jgi:E3 ubiquitin-protein ligase ATL6/9/15/31/42/55
MATVIIVVLASVFVFVVFFSVYLKRCMREVEQADGSSSSTGTGPAAVALPLPTAAAVSGSDNHHHHHRRRRLPLELQRGGVGQGLNKALVEALPILSFSVVKDLRKRGRSEGGSKESLDCAVCLNEFGKDENLLLRLLPACNHAFHVDCIDVWFQSHSTCPLCRSSLLPIFKEQLADDDDGGGGGGGAAAAVTVEEAASRRILEAQGQNCGSGAAARDGRRILLPESWSSSFTGTPRQSASVEQITAEEEEEGKNVLHLPLCNSRTEKLWTIISSHPCCLCVELFWEAAAAAASANWLIVLLNQEIVVHAIHQEAAAAAEMTAATLALSEERRIRGTTAVSQSWHSLAILNLSD